MDVLQPRTLAAPKSKENKAKFSGLNEIVPFLDFLNLARKAKMPGGGRLAATGEKLQESVAWKSETSSFHFLKLSPYHRSKKWVGKRVVAQISSCSQIFRRTNYTILDFPCNWISCKWNSI